LSTLVVAILQMAWTTHPLWLGLATLSAPQSAFCASRPTSHLPSRSPSPVSAPSAPQSSCLRWHSPPAPGPCAPHLSQPLARRLRSPVAPAHASGSAARVSSPTSLFLSVGVASRMERVAQPSGSASKALRYVAAPAATSAPLLRSPLDPRPCHRAAARLREVNL
jgi:hypothetical protein